MNPDGRRENGDEGSEKQYGRIAERFNKKSGRSAVKKRTLKDNEILQKCKEGERAYHDKEEGNARIEIAGKYPDRETEGGRKRKGGEDSISEEDVFQHGDHDGGIDEHQCGYRREYRERDRRMLDGEYRKKEKGREEDESGADDLDDEVSQGVSDAA